MFFFKSLFFARSKKLFLVEKEERPLYLSQFFFVTSHSIKKSKLAFLIFWSFFSFSNFHFCLERGSSKPLCRFVCFDAQVVNFLKFFENQTCEIISFDIFFFAPFFLATKWKFRQKGVPFSLLHHFSCQLLFFSFWKKERLVFVCLFSYLGDRKLEFKKKKKKFSPVSRTKKKEVLCFAFAFESYFSLRQIFDFSSHLPTVVPTIWHSRFFQVGHLLVTPWVFVQF